MSSNDEVREQKATRPSPRVLARQLDARKRILEAARGVIGDLGFAGAQVATVADIAGVATGTIYRHFTSKAELFSEVLRAVCERELDVVRAIAAEEGRTAAERLHDAVFTFVARALQSGDLAYAVIVEPMDSEVDHVRLAARRGLADAFAALIREGISAGEYPEQNAELRGAAVVGAFLEGVVHPLEQSLLTLAEREEVGEEIAQFCVAALTKRA
ncbi:TetR/AcrR family transcriptional regulator [Leucobacter sp. M11]|uniref:TetR/AcrR family transcriptional regulator n=1 Tax=Leucobacter sp. M11 TaxID=2993565 RepID=UPI002D8066FD|nr:TetR/AcrR family transcriptional regulator [Leucobacter sp. M11]MEB4615378.1 TetR/AcrR family transcriptional regulator [Leucobacter sp. M11]